ncbi:D-alanine--D-alanine ligase [Halorhodospira sp. 9621]|uniref:D-alanine--D-alanine ligase family protein n=1 Tax=Halorhodospira TaxID=85108 RepID=UPI001EE8C26C|nr:D-alanine--D-alanine ligase [Halorhodospira halophila]MCG5532242.1 D-alanine--D-alanine ligase [Halorhodospira sp. 9621]MCG5544440.1 D-alanine--D-alanine ligase [Halorhodospira sp. 9628]
MNKLTGLRLGLLFGDPRLPYAYGPYGRIGPEELAAAEEAKRVLAALPGVSLRVFDDHERLIDDLRDHPPDLAVNFCDNGYRNRLELEASIPALLEMLAIPYTGTTATAMGLGRDKGAVRALAAGLGVAVPEEWLIDLRDPRPVVPKRYPVLIKPNDSCGSIGMEPDCVVRDARQARAYLRRLAGSGVVWALAQEFLPGAEYTVGLVGNPATRLSVLPPLVVDYSALPPELPPILSYGSKTDPESAYYRSLRFAPARLDEAKRVGLEQAARQLFARLGARDYARVDFREDAEGKPRLLDFNNHPAWGPEGKLAMMAGYAGFSYAELLGQIVQAAVERYGAAGRPLGGQI